MTKAVASWCVVVKKNCFRVFSILMFGEEAVCPDGFFVPAVFREVCFYLNSLILTSPIPIFSWAEWSSLPLDMYVLRYVLEQHLI